MSFLADVTYSIRAMRQSPGVTATAVIALALGMGANTAIFTAVNSVLLNSAALRGLRDPGRMVMVWETNPEMMAFLAEHMLVALENYRQWKRQSQSLEDWTIYSTTSVNLAAVSSSERGKRVAAARVPPDFFANLGVKPTWGRSFTAGELRDGADRVVVVGAGIYRTRFGGDSNLSGKTLRIDGKERAIAGVLPDGFQLPAMWGGFDQNKPEIWLPLDVEGAKSDDDLWIRAYFVYARLRPGVRLEQARTEMTVIGKRLQMTYPEPNKGFGVNVVSLALEDAGPDVRKALYVLQCAVGFVLLIACANVANLLLARAVGREREIAIRLALGAPRSRIVRLVLTESLLLSITAGATGLLLGYWSLGAISALAPRDIHGLHELRLDPLPLAVNFLVALGTGLLFGMAPALHSVRQNLVPSLNQGARGSSGRSLWARNALVTVEVALAVILLVGAGLLIRNLRNLMDVDPGFRVDHLLTAQASFSQASDPKAIKTERLQAVCNQLLERLRQLPGVAFVSVSSGLPMESVSEGDYEVEGGVPSKGDKYRIAGHTRVTETFFRTMGIPIRRGRDFTREEAEAKDPAVVIVNEPFARANWPGQDPLEKVVLISGGNGPKLRLRVAGVVGGIHQMGPESQPRAEIFIPSRAFSDMNLALRTTGDPASLAAGVEKVVSGIDPDLSVQQTRDMQQVLHEWLSQPRYLMSILAVFAGLALLLASVGLYGVLAYLVNLRTRELGIRMALGAGTWQVLGLVMGQGLKLALIGTSAGLVMALALARLMSSLVTGVATHDPATFGTVAAVLVAAALCATAIPARRAASVDPVQALRAE